MSYEQFSAELFQGIAGYVMNRWVKTISPTAMINADDLIAEGYLGALHAIESSQPAPDGSNDGAWLWNWVRPQVDWSIQQYLEKFGFAADEPVDARPLDEETERTSIRVRAAGNSTIHRELADILAILPTRTKIYLALRLFEELTLEEVAHILDSDFSSVSGYIIRASKDFVTKATGLIVEYPPELVHHTPRPWPIPDSVHEWVQSAYGTDVHTYLGVVQICYRLDVSYIVDIIDQAHGRVMSVGHRTSAAVRREDFQALCALDPAPTSGIEAATRIGIPVKRAQAAMRQWRTTTGRDADEDRAATQTALRDA